MKTVGAVAVIVVMFMATFARIGGTQTPAKPATETCTLKVSGMTCAGCEAAVRIAARSVEGVTDVKVSHAKGNAVVTFDPSKTTPDAIAKVITDKLPWREGWLQSTVARELILRNTRAWRHPS